MPYGFNSPVFTSSAGGDIGGGRHFTRFRGPLLMGAVAQDMAGTPKGGQAPTLGAPWLPPHLTNVSSQRGDMLLSIVSTFGNPFISNSSASNVTTSAPAGLVYISMATGAGNLIAAASTANAPLGLPGGANGVAICWDQAAATLAVYDPGTSAWMYPHQAASSNVALGGTITWSASSS